MQPFTVTVPVEGKDQQFVLRAEVSLPPTLVVAARSLPRGALIHEADVLLQPGRPAQGATHVFESLDEVIGKEAVRAIVEGQILDEQSVRRPILVHKNEVVTVYARASGISVRTTARTKDDGAKGELVTVETLADRKTFFARVVGPQEVEVYAHAAPIAADDPAQRPATSKAIGSTVTPGNSLIAVQPPLPAVKIGATLVGPDGGLTNSIQQAAAFTPAVDPKAVGAMPGSVLAQAALRRQGSQAKPNAASSRKFSRYPDSSGNHE
jgi:flagella basal body P-ring formation protein FlgA